jgi:hypothetical protein
MVPGIAMPPSPLGARISAINAASRAGMLSGLTLCVDAGEMASYGGTGQTWADLSGNAQDFHLGADASATSTDPAFAGTAGRLSGAEKWTFDGTKYFRLKTANTTAINSIHKDGWIGSMAAVFHTDGNTSAQVFAGTTGNALNGTGFFMQRSGGASNLTCRITIRNGTNAVLNSGDFGSVQANKWNFAFFSIDESAGTGVRLVNGSSGTFTSTYSSPDTGNAAQTLEIGARGNGVNPIGSADSIAIYMFWDGVHHSAAKALSLFNMLRGRFAM